MESNPTKYPYKHINHFSDMMVKEIENEKQPEKEIIRQRDDGMICIDEIKYYDIKRLDDFCKTLNECIDISADNKKLLIEDFKVVNAIYNEMIDEHKFGWRCIDLTDRFILARLCAIRKIPYDEPLDPKLKLGPEEYIRNRYWYMICQKV